VLESLVLKSDELYLAGEISTDGSGERAAGLYLRDTRFLSQFLITLDGEPLSHLTSRTLALATGVIVSTNGLLSRPDDDILPHSLGIEQRVTLTDEMTVALTLRNYTPRPLSFVLAITTGSDFRDLFDIRGFPRPKRGVLLPIEQCNDGFVLRSQGLDNIVAATKVGFGTTPTAMALPEPYRLHSERAVLLPGLDRIELAPREIADSFGSATFDVGLSPREHWHLIVKITPLPPDGKRVSRVATLRDGRPPTPATIQVDEPNLQAFLQQGREDLAMLQTSFPEGSLPAAGIPWYVAPFGRDSLIVGLQTYTVSPRRALATLRMLASHQGTEVDARREEEPGKILHEIRYGEMARLGEVPHTPYYGSVDATPLFVMLFARTIGQLGDTNIYEELLPSVRRAVTWMEDYGDPDGDGLLEYFALPPDGVRIVHQGWKDSHDSLHHVDGSPVFGSVALVEVQGYAYAAYTWLADVVGQHGEPGWAEHLRDRAAHIRRVVNDRFWMEDNGYYAQALDDAKHPVKMISSNPGHLLFCSLPDQRRAQLTAAGLRQPDLDSGWGIRTLGSRETTYNPLSYHNGSVWPHDNSLIAAGLAKYGFAGDADRILRALVAVASQEPLGRLPELYCGFARDDEDADLPPVPYPVSCSPQAWAAAAMECIVVNMLGISMAPGELALQVKNPRLPRSVNRLEIRNIRVGYDHVTMVFERQAGSIKVTTSGPVSLL
jgi:glycogen debranching enzyme